MAAFHGKRGTASFTSLTFEITSFNLEATCDTADVTIMDSSAVAAATHWKDYVAGFKDWTATAECVEPVAGSGIAALGTEATLTMDTTDGLSYAGTAICTALSPSASTTDAGRVT
ncbi:MAG: hypothetical protein ACYS21_12685, partial [Planctomycetota bacterium]